MVVIDEGVADLEVEEIDIVPDCINGEDAVACSQHLLGIHAGCYRGTLSSGEGEEADYARPSPPGRMYTGILLWW